MGFQATQINTALPGSAGLAPTLTDAAVSQYHREILWELFHQQLLGELGWSHQQVPGAVWRSEFPLLGSTGWAPLAQATRENTWHHLTRLKICFFTFELRRNVPLSLLGVVWGKPQPLGNVISVKQGDQTHPAPAALVRMCHRLLAAAGARHFCTAPFEPLMFIFSMPDVSLFTTLFHNQVTRLDCSSWARPSTGSHWETLCVPVSSSSSSHFCFYRSSLHDKQHFSLKAVLWKVAWILVRVSVQPVWLFLSTAPSGRSSSRGSDSD